jgi:hypothetical protein
MFKAKSMRETVRNKIKKRIGFKTITRTRTRTCKRCTALV